MGFGKEWKSTFEFLKKFWIDDITILDRKKFEEFDVEEKKILSSTANVLWDDYLDNLQTFDYIIKSPWVSPYQEKLNPFRDKLLDQTQIFFSNFKGKIIAVTWTKWKSTVTTLIYELLKKSWYKVEILWNIWKPSLDYIYSDYDFVVYEMSSYMLELAHINPYISVIINLYQEHLDYHQWFENYKKAKLNIIWKDSIVICHSSLKDILQWYNNTKILFGESGEYTVDKDFFYHFQEKLYSTSDIKIIWYHNLTNICVANAVADIFHIPPAQTEQIVKSFIGLRHRMQHVATKNWIIFFDDAISTTPQSTIAAIDALKDNIQTIFLWGTDRWYDFKELAKFILNSKIQNIVFFPDTGKRIKSELISLCPDINSRFQILEADNMNDAVVFAFHKTWEGRVCLLSCASPSYTLWKNFEVKGDDFKKNIDMYVG